MKLQMIGKCFFVDFFIFFHLLLAILNHLLAFNDFHFPATYLYSRLFYHLISLFNQLCSFLCFFLTAAPLFAKFLCSITMFHHLIANSRRRFLLAIKGR